MHEQRLAFDQCKAVKDNSLPSKTIYTLTDEWGLLQPDTQFKESPPTNAAPMRAPGLGTALRDWFAHVHCCLEPTWMKQMLPFVSCIPK